MSLNTHKSWHIHREVNRKKTRQLQSSLDEARSKSAAELDAILSGESVTTEELLQQIYELAESRGAEPSAQYEQKLLPVTPATSFEEEFARFDPLVYPIDGNLANEQRGIEKRENPFCTPDRQIGNSKHRFRKISKPGLIRPMSYSSHPRKPSATRHAPLTQMRKQEISPNSKQRFPKPTPYS